MGARTVVGAMVATTLAVTVISPASAQSAAAIPRELITPDRMQTNIGTLEFKDGVPTVETAEKVRDTLDFTRALNVYNNSFRGASAYAIGKGFQSIGAEDNTIVIFSELMDAKSLFLTANADTVYFLGVLNLSKGPLVVEQPPGSLGTFNDMWFSWIIDGGFPAPIAAKAASTCSCRRAMTVRCRTAASSSPSRRRTACSTPFAHSSSTTTPSRPSRTSRRTSRSIRTRRAATARASRRRSKARCGSAETRPIPATKFVEATGKAFNTVPPSDYGFFEMINENVQQEPATSYDVELAGQLAAIGIVKGKPFNPDARMKKILTDAAAVGNAAGRMLNWRYAVAHPDWAYYPGSKWGNMLWEGGAFFETPPPEFTGGHVQALAADRRAHARLADRVLLRLHDGLAGHDHAHSRRRLAVSDGLPRHGQAIPSTAPRPTR